MSRQAFFVALPIVLLSCVPAKAGDFWTNFWTDWHRNNSWMEPFVYPDRASVCHMTELQIAKGWQLQNTLGDPHFEADNVRLSPAGVSKLRWILTQNPAQARNVFVQRGLSDDITTRRLATAQQAAAEIGRGSFSEVLVSDVPLPNTPARNIVATEAYLAGYLQSMPKPAPKAFTGDISGGSGGGSSQ